MSRPAYLLIPKEVGDTEDPDLLVFTIVPIESADKPSSIKSYFYNLGIAVDQFFNVLLGGAADETLSARAHRMRMKKHKYWGWTANVIDVLFFFDKNHCETSYLAELQRKHSPAAYTKM